MSYMKLVGYLYRLQRKLSPQKVRVISDFSTTGFH